MRTCTAPADRGIEGGGNFDCIGQPVLSRRCFDAVCPLFGLVITISFIEPMEIFPPPASVLVDSCRL